MDPSCPSGPMRQNPTAQRLAELLSAWLPDSSEGLYHQYLESLSPQFDHLLTFSRYDRIGRFSKHESKCLGFHSPIALKSSPVHVIDIGSQHETYHRVYSGTDVDSMEALKQHLTDENLPNPSCRIVCAQHLTCLSMETLGVGLSMDPEAFSHHIGMSHKEIEKVTGIDKLCNIKTDDIPTSIGLYERDKNLQIVREDLGPLQFANVNHTKTDLRIRNLLQDGVPSVARTISIDLPRTIYVQGYQKENGRPSILRQTAPPLGLQDPILDIRMARQRFADDSMLWDQGEKYSQNALDILQHITVNITRYSQGLPGKQVLILFPPYPQLDGDNDPFVFLDPLSKKDDTKSFREFADGQQKEHSEPRESGLQDVEIFVNDLLLELQARGKSRLGYRPSPPYDISHAIALMRTYAIGAWSDCLASLENQLQDLDLDSYHERTQDEEHSQISESMPCKATERENGMITAILRYISTLDLLCEYEQGSIERRRQYVYIKSRMQFLLPQVQHRLEMKVMQTQATPRARGTTSEDSHSMSDDVKVKGEGME